MSFCLDMVDKMCFYDFYRLLLCFTIKQYTHMGKSIALENTNVLIINKKMDEYIAEQKMTAKENKCRLVQLVLRHKVHRYPVNIPFIAAVKSLKDGKVAVFNLKRTAFATIDGDAIASETNVGREFVIDGVRYVRTDTVDGMARYKPVFPKRGRAYKLEVEERDKLSHRNL